MQLIELPHIQSFLLSCLFPLHLPTTSRFLSTYYMACSHNELFELCTPQLSALPIRFEWPQKAQKTQDYNRVRAYFSESCLSFFCAFCASLRLSKLVAAGGPTKAFRVTTSQNVIFCDRYCFRLIRIYLSDRKLNCLSRSHGVHGVFVYCLSLCLCASVRDILHAAAGRAVVLRALPVNQKSNSLEQRTICINLCPNCGKKHTFF